MNTYSSTTTANTTDGSCNVFGGGTGIANCLSGLVYVFTVGLGSAFAWVGASFLNYAVHLSLDSAAYALDFVATGWTTARDIANMAFIFILIYLAVTIMFQAQTAHSMQTLAGVIVIALIINFSFFFTRLVIDAGNLLSVQFYNAIIASNPTITVNTGVVDGQVAVPDITASIMEGLDLQKALGSQSFQQYAKSQQGADAFGGYLIAMCFIFITVGAMFFMLAATFLTAGVKFLIRIVVLWFMIIAAPLALAVRASGIHSLEHYYKDWQSSLIRHAFYPVAFLFVFWILSKFMGDMNKSGNLSAVFDDLNKLGSITGSDFIVNLGAFIATIAIRLGFVVAILYVGIRAADRFGTMGAAWAQNFGQKVSLGGLSGYTQRLGWAGNRFVARPAASVISQPLGSAASVGSTFLKRSGALNQNGPIGTLARGANRNVLQPLTKTSFAGEKSYSKLMADQREKNKEGDGRNAINEALKFSEVVPPSETASAAEKENYEKQKEEHKKSLEKLNANMFLGISDAKLTQLSDRGIIKDEVSKKIHDSPDFSEDTKHHVEDAVKERNSREDVEYLKKIDEKLGELTAKTEEGDVKLKDLLKVGMKLDKKNTATIKKALQEKHDDAEERRKEAEGRRQEAIRLEVDAIKTGNTTAATSARTMIDEQKKIIIQTKNDQRNANDGIKRLDKTPKEKSSKEEKH